MNSTSTVPSAVFGVNFLVAEISVSFPVVLSKIVPLISYSLFGERFSNLTVSTIVTFLAARILWLFEALSRAVVDTMPP